MSLKMLAWCLYVFRVKQSNMTLRNVQSIKKYTEVCSSYNYKAANFKVFLAECLQTTQPYLFHFLFKDTRHVKNCGFFV